MDGELPKSVVDPNEKLTQVMARAGEKVFCHVKLRRNL